MSLNGYSMVAIQTEHEVVSYLDMDSPESAVNWRSKDWMFLQWMQSLAMIRLGTLHRCCGMFQCFSVPGAKRGIPGATSCPNWYSEWPQNGQGNCFSDSICGSMAGHSIQVVSIHDVDVLRNNIT